MNKLFKTGVFKTSMPHMFISTSRHILLPESFHTLGGFKTKFHFCCFFSKPVGPVVWIYLYVLCVIHLNFSTDQLECLAFRFIAHSAVFSSADELMRAFSNRGNVCVVETFTGWRSLSSRLLNFGCKMQGGPLLVVNKATIPIHKWTYKRITGVINPISGVITQLTTSRGPILWLMHNMFLHVFI